MTYLFILFYLYFYLFIYYTISLWKFPLLPRLRFENPLFTSWPNSSICMCFRSPAFIVFHCFVVLQGALITLFHKKMEKMDLLSLPHTVHENGMHFIYHRDAFSSKTGSRYSAGNLCGLVTTTPFTLPSNVDFFSWCKMQMEKNNKDCRLVSVFFTKTCASGWSLFKKHAILIYL